MQRLRMRGALPPLPHTSSWRGTLKMCKISSCNKDRHITSGVNMLLRSMPVRCTTVYPKVSGLSHNEINNNNTRWEATQRVMATKLTRLTHKIAIQLHLVAESSNVFSSRSRWPVRKLLDTPSYVERDEVGRRDNTWTWARLVKNLLEINNIMYETLQ
jgi:hypothetical protein